MRKSTPDISATLKQIQLRLSVVAGQRLTHSDLADIAGVGVRSIGEWMRGTAAPSGIPAILRLLSSLSQEDVSAVLLPWESSDVTEENLAIKTDDKPHESSGKKSVAELRKHTRTINTGTRT